MQATTARGARLAGDLFDANVELHRDLVRNIPGIRRSQHLFDDLSDDPDDWTAAMAAESAGRIETGSAVVTRPFDYGTAITYSFEAAHWQATRFSDGTRYGVWYGSWDATTTVYETAHHWSRFVRDSYGTEDRAIRTERRLFEVRCDALLVDLRGKEKSHPGLVDRKSYAFCQQVGRHVHEQGQNGLVVRSARWTASTRRSCARSDCAILATSCSSPTATTRRATSSSSSARKAARGCG